MILTLPQAQSYAEAAGFTGYGLLVILAIAQAESGLNTTARNTAGNTPPSTDRGILQINSYWHSEVSDAQADDPAFAFKWAYGVTGGTDFHQWSTYQNGAYLKFMFNIPSNDPGVKLVPGVETFCEWLVRLSGSIATCVESSEMVVDHIATRGRIPVSAAEDTALAQDLINRGQASANGATNYVAAAEQMTRLGIPNTAYGPDWFGSHDFSPLARAAIDRGVGVLFGIYAAHNLHDDWTNAAEDGGVNGHGIALVGYDNSGFIVADPNTSQAESGNFVHYTVADLQSAFGGFPSMVIPEVVMSTPLDSSFTIAADGSSYTLKSDTSIVLSGGELALFLQLNGASGLPKGGLTGYSEFKAILGGDFGVCYRLYERVIFLYDPQHKVDSQPGFGAWFLAQIADPRFGVAGSAPSDDEAAEAAQLTALQSQVAALNTQVSALKASQASAVSALTSASQVLSPIGAAADEVVAALKAAQA